MEVIETMGAGFNGAPALWPGRGARFQCLGVPAVGFNGAPALWPGRESSLGPSQGCQGWLASTEPRPFGRGELPADGDVSRAGMPLQRSPGPLAGERRWGGLILYASEWASTEPRPFGRGESALCNPF